MSRPVMPMLRLVLILLVVLGVAWLWHGFRTVPAPAATPLPAAPVPPDTTAAPVVLELFTSQGCSSCPPADRLLSDLGRRYGDAVIPLSFHVDYWNDLGWADPFSDPVWSARQTRYAAQLNAGVYTPQLVMQGQVVMVGSQETRVRQHLAALRTRPLGTQVHLTPIQESAGTLRLTVDVAVRQPIPAHTLDVVVAVFESGLTTEVKRGENARRRLHNDYVVRHLQRAGTLAAATGTTHQATLTLSPPEGGTTWGVVALVQDATTGRVHGVARWPESRPPAADQMPQN